MSEPGSSAPSTALILAGGLGTRLRSRVADRPKVLAPVAGRPMLTYLLDQLAEAGITRVVLATGYLGELIEQELGAHYGSIALFYSREPEPLGTGGAVRFARDMLGNETVLVLNGDSYVHTNLRAFIADYRAHQPSASLVLTQVDDPARFGSVSFDLTGAVTAFREKGQVTDPSAAWINAGIYLLSPGAIASLPDGAFSIERELFPSLIGNGLRAFPGGGRFIDIGVPESFDAAAAFFSAPLPRTSLDLDAALLDRDGTLMINVPYLGDPAQVELLPGAGMGVAALHALGLRVAIITNQSGIGRGKVTEAEVGQVHERLQALLGAHGGAAEAIFHCPHAPDAGCECRKPAAGLVRQAEAQLRIRAEQSILAGDNECDIELAEAVGAVAVLVTTGYGAELLARRAVTPDLVVDSIADLALLLGHERGLSGVRRATPPGGRATT